MEQSSLQRLKALNKSTNDFVADLNEGADILNLPYDWLEHDPGALKELGYSYGTQKRAEWLLKWLLEKLSSSNVSTINPRLVRQAWVFLRWLVFICPVQSAAKQLIDARFLHILQKALSELEQPTTLPMANTDQDDVSGIKSKSIKKRKRRSESPVADRTAAFPNPHLVLAIQLSLQALVSLAKSSSSSKPSKNSTEQVLIALTTDVAAAAELLRLWQVLLLSLPADPAQCTLSAILPIWDASVSRGVSGTQEVAPIFCNACLVPTLKLLHRTQSDPSNADVLRSQLEQLLIRYLILPSRVPVLSAMSKTRRRKEDEVVEQGSAQALLQPLHQKTLSLLAAQARHSDDVQTTQRLASYVFDIALSICNRSTPKAKAREEPWLRGLFVALCQSMEVPITETSRIPVRPHSSPALCEMLDVSFKHDFSPGQHLLDSIIRRYSGMCLEEESIDWAIVGKVLRLDSNIFLPRGTRQQPPNSYPDDVSLHELIIRNLSSLPWSSDYDIYTASRAISARGDGGFDASACAFAMQNDMTPEIFMSSLPIALMNAYAHARDLSGFLEIWRTVLVKCTRHIVIGTGTGSIWEDQSLTVALRQVFAASLTEQQILGILTRLAAPFAELEEAQNILYVFTELRQDAQGTGAAANLVLLDAIMAAIRSNAVVEICKEQLFALHESLLSVGSKPAVNKLPIVHRIWRTLSSTEALLIPTLTTAEAAALVDKVVVSNCTQAAIDAINEGRRSDTNVSVYERAREALNYVLALYSHQTVEDMNAKVLDNCIDCILVEDGLSRHDLAVCLLRYPCLFEAISPEKRGAIFDYFTTAAAQHRDQTDETLKGFSSDGEATASLVAVVDLATTTFSASARLDLLRSLVKEFRHVGSKSKRSHLSDLSEAMLMRFPASLIPRSLREECLGILHHLIKAKADTSRQDGRLDWQRSLQSHLAFVVRLTEVPNAGAELCKNPHSLLHLCVDQDFIDQPQCEALYEELVHRIVSHSSSQSPFITDLAKVVLADLTKSASLASSTVWIAARQLVLIVDADTRERLCLCVAKGFRAVSQRIADGANPVNDHKLSVLMDSLRLCWQSIKNSEVCMRKISMASVREIKYIGPGQNGTQLASSQSRPKTAIDRFLLIASYNSALEECIAAQKALGDRRSITEERQILADLKAALLERSSEQRVNVLDRLDALSPTATFSTSALRVLHVLLTTLGGSSRAFAGTELGTDILARLANEALVSGDPAVLGGIFECINTLLSERSWLVSQHGVDALLGCNTTLTSASAPSMPVEVAGGLYIQLCSSTKALIALQRIKLRGRFHLLTPLLVNLLNCLFVPHSRTSKEGPLRLPSWLSGGASPLSARHATAFARLLSTFASPTVSSVSSYKRRRTDTRSSVPLKDETKLARAYVGEHVPMLLAAYCSAQLHGKMPLGVRDALMPGLWACMETVEMDAWRAMSDRMRENERAIWQSVWAEWKRVGGGGRGRDGQPV